MSGVTVGGGNGVSLNYTSTDALGVASALASQITSNLNNNTFTAFSYTGNGPVAPQPTSGTGGVAVFTQPTTAPVFVDGADQAIVVSGNGPYFIQGGAAGGSFLAGSGMAGARLNVSYTNITPTGDNLDQIAILGGNNQIQTATFGTGNYNVQTGSGNDSVSILSGNSTINAGTGNNTVNVGPGSNLVYSEGFDSITGAVTGGGSDTVNIGSGQTSINPATSNFLINDSSPNSLLVALGSATTTVVLGGEGSGVIDGPNSTSTITGAGTVVAHPTSTGDVYTVSGAANANIVAGAQNDFVDGSGSSGNEVFRAGTGNDTLIAGSGAAILSGAIGPNATAVLVSGSNLSTIFAFVDGQFSGGSDTIYGFKSSDVLSLQGYGADPQGTVKSVGGSTVVTLPDNTTITIVGATPTIGQYRVS